MKLSYFLLGLLFVSCNGPQQTEENELQSIEFFVGTYTNGDSQGIYKYELSKEGQIKNLGLMAQTENPSYMAKSVDGAFLVVVNEISDENKEARVESYKILEDSLILIDQKTSGGAHPCQVSINGDGFVAVANYSGGNVGLLKMDEKGKLSNLDVQQHIGKGTDSTRQEGPHAHSVYFYPRQHQLISADLGTNELWFSEIDLKNEKLKPIGENLKMEEGAGPRHICFHPNMKWFYVINEMHGSITHVEIMEDGSYQTRSTISTLKADFNAENYSADIHISSDGRFVYASNRGPNEIAIFKVDDKNGQLSLLSHVPTKGNWPRNFTLSPDEKFLLVAHQYSNNICCFKRDAQSGLLEFVSEIEAPNPVCLLF
jgi:6-phosphogluconolactonase